MSHERVPYDDPESRGDLYILAPMRLLTPVIEETDSDITKSRLYQSLASVIVLVEERTKIKGRYKM